VDGRDRRDAEQGVKDAEGGPCPALGQGCDGCEEVGLERGLEVGEVPVGEQAVGGERGRGYVLAFVVVYRAEEGEGGEDRGQRCEHQKDVHPRRRVPSLGTRLRG
jgi:hypothetical protein